MDDGLNIGSMYAISTSECMKIPYTFHTPRINTTINQYNIWQKKGYEAYKRTSYILERTMH